MTEAEKKELKQLIALKKKNQLTDDQAKRLDELNKKCGYSGKKTGRRGKGDSDKITFKPGNDFAWWNKAYDLLKDAANYKCNYIAGEQLDAIKFPYIVPGVARFQVMPTYGKSIRPTDPVNVWARDLYLKMFQKYRPASGYAAPDLGIALIAGIELVKIIATYERIYGVINRYNTLNVNMPYCEEEALGLTHAQADYLRGHLSDFRYDINELIRRAQRVVIPKDISLVANAISLFGYEYLDHESPRSQIIIFQDEYFGFYDETDLSAGNVKFEKVDYSQLFDFTKDNMCVYLEDAVAALIGSDSVQRIFADLVTWFGQDAMLVMIPIPEDFVVLPTYSEEILHKIHNAEIYFHFNAQPFSGAINTLSAADALVVNQSYRVYQDGESIVTAFSMVEVPSTQSLRTVGNMTYVVSDAYPCDGYFTNHILDAYHNDLDETLVTEGCLWKSTFAQSFDSGNVLNELVTCAFEIIRTVELFENGFASNPFFADYMTTSTASLAQARAGSVAVLDWAPLSYRTNNYSDVCTYIYGDIDNVTPISGNGLVKLHRAVIYSGLHTDVTPIKS